MWSFVGKSPGCPQQPIFEVVVVVVVLSSQYLNAGSTWGRRYFAFSTRLQHMGQWLNIIHCISIVFVFGSTLALHVCTCVHFIRGNKWKLRIPYQILCLSISIPHCQSLSFLRHWALQDNLVKPLSSLCALPLSRRGSPCSRQFWWNSPHLLQFSVASGTHTASSWSGSSTPPHSKHLTHISRF